MAYVSIGGMQLKHWTGYFKIILPTMRVLRAAKHADGCIHADTFKDGNTFFATSTWETEEQMCAFAKSGLHGKLNQVAMSEMAMFFNLSIAIEHAPSRQEAVTAWKNVMAERNGKATVGTYSE